MTRLEITKKMLPGIDIGERTGYPISCPDIYDHVFASERCDCKCDQCKRDFWETEIDLTDNAEEPIDSEKILAALNDIYARLEQLETLIRISNPINVTGTTSGTIKPKNTQEIIITV